MAQQGSGRACRQIAEQTSAGVALEFELAHELEAQAEAHARLEAVSERPSAGRPTDRKS